MIQTYHSIAYEHSTIGRHEIVVIKIHIINGKTRRHSFPVANEYGFYSSRAELLYHLVHARLVLGHI
jgi:hypothetical protein